MEEYREMEATAVSELLKKIMPSIMCKSNSEDNLKLFIGYELKKFHSNAFADGQLNVLEYKK